jgi:hypothetical protein
LKGGCLSIKGQEKFFDAGFILRPLSAFRKSLSSSVLLFSLRSKHCVSSDQLRQPSCLICNTKTLRTTTSLHDERIPYLVHTEWGSRIWGDRSNLRTAAALVRPFISHRPEREPSIDPSDESRDGDVGRTSDEDEDDDFQINHAPGPGSVPFPAHRTPATQPPNIAATSEEVNVFIQWFIEVGEIERLTRHQQIRDMTLRLLELAPPPSYSRIGAIFGMKNVRSQIIYQRSDGQARQWDRTALGIR